MISLVSVLGVLEIIGGYIVRWWYHHIVCRRCFLMIKLIDCKQGSFIYGWSCHQFTMVVFKILIELLLSDVPYLGIPLPQAIIFKNYFYKRKISSTACSNLILIHCCVGTLKLITDACHFSTKGGGPYLPLSPME